MPSFQQILTSIADAWTNQRDEILHSASEVISEIERVGLTDSANVNLAMQLLDDAFQKLNALLIALTRYSAERQNFLRR
jgi:uncharacterized protein YyaL (SSP411 family)